MTDTDLYDLGCCALRRQRIAHLSGDQERALRERSTSALWLNRWAALARAEGRPSHVTSRVSA